MENQDKIFDQFKSAAQKAETKDFPGMDKVWSRVDEKLDKKILAKKSNLWRKMAVAASIVALISIVYPFLKTENEMVTPTELPENNTVIQEKTIEAEPEIVDKNPSGIIKKDAEKILEKQIEVKQAWASNPKKEEEKAAPIQTDKATESEQPIQNSSNYTLKGKVFDAIGVHHVSKEQIENVPEKADQITQKSPPLVILDGKKTDEKTISKMDDDDIESVVYLKEPLYIINGVHYSEKELFGPNPTSPYAPLDKQDIKTVMVLQDEEAVEKYGRKGEKGVVIITTKNGKPAVQK